ncbi:hypothetical protein BDR07DRAFT_523583 [Suillus spraguei]|nr:hypothetical protein BDR07DRAFT_523583 [Suillus spraguei]
MSRYTRLYLAYHACCHDHDFLHGTHAPYYTKLAMTQWTRYRSTIYSILRATCALRLRVYSLYAYLYLFIGTCMFRIPIVHLMIKNRMSGCLAGTFNEFELVRWDALRGYRLGT